MKVVCILNTNNFAFYDFFIQGYMRPTDQKNRAGRSKIELKTENRFSRRRQIVWQKLPDNRQRNKELPDRRHMSGRTLPADRPAIFPSDSPACEKQENRLYQK